jgi:hypothetical protein
MIEFQEPAFGILKCEEWGKTKTYHIRCKCGSPECSHDVWIEADETEITVTTYLSLRSKWYRMSRWKQIWSILVNGYVDVESTLVMDQQTALNYAATLKAAVEDVKEIKNGKLQRF